MRVRAGVATLLLTAAVVVPVLPGGPAAAAVEEDCSSVEEESSPQHVATRESAPLEQLRIAEAHAYLRQRGVQPGAGVTVAVLDSGVTTRGGVTVSEHVSTTERRDLLDYHGTAVAGLIAGQPRADGGLVGIAPYAQVLDVRIFDAADTPDASPVTADGLVAGLKLVAKRRDVDIVNVSLLVDEPDPRIERLVDRLRKRDVVVVAASGNRPADGDALADLYDAQPQPGEDAARHVFPAGYDSVVAVSATVDGLPDGEDASTYVLANSATDIAAPVVGGVTVGLDGGTCTVDDVVTSWATAEVSGVLALMRSLDTDATADQLVSRLLSTADGRPDVTSPMTGAGVVQPLDALRRPVSPAPDGTLPDPVVERSDEQETAPAAEPDTMAEPRQEAVWWGVVGGGLLLLAVVLRPLLARRGPQR